MGRPRLEREEALGGGRVGGIAQRVADLEVGDEVCWWVVDHEEREQETGAEDQEHSVDAYGSRWGTVRGVFLVVREVGVVVDFLRHMENNFIIPDLMY